jgi:TatD DNase family protein
MMPYIDFHTHHARQDFDLLQILNVIYPSNADETPKNYFSVGVHPWYLNENDSLAEIENWLMTNGVKKTVLAIGECGLDKAKGASYDVQKNVFLLHVSVSETLHKPLIIHNVRCLNELIEFRKRLRPNMPWILHGFHGNVDQAIQCVKHGFYFSVGGNVIKDRGMNDVLQTLPLERLFMESDDSFLDIRELYGLIASELGLKESELREIIGTNFKSIFPELCYV